MVASFHLVRYSSAGRAFMRAGPLRKQLKKDVEGLSFFRVLGTGKGDRDSFPGTGSDLSRTAIFAVWDDEAALDAFLADDGPAKEIGERADELWSVRMRPFRARGTWGGTNPLEEVAPEPPGDGPVAIFTYGKLRARNLVRFWRNEKTPAADLVRQEGLIDAIGCGELPLLRPSTFSLWRSLDDALTFAYKRPDHHDFVGKSRREKWHTEEFYARFEPYASEGAWAGRDPLAGARETTAAAADGA